VVHHKGKPAGLSKAPTDVDLKGSSVKESEPAKFEFYWDKKVAEGRPSIIEMAIYACEDSQDNGPPMYADNRGTFVEDHRQNPQLGKKVPY
jgi:hypothetical protein